MEELDGCPAPKKRKVEGESSIAEQLLGIERDMCRQLEAVDIGPPVTHIYNPLDYAAQTHSDFVQNYGNSTKKILFVGMNPGPFGMAQNGVAFGDTAMVKDWLCVDGEVGKPAHEHPKRIIQGMECSRAEVSGSRFWGLFKDLCTTPQVFFTNCYVHNYCPLCFMNKTGKNITPPALKPLPLRNQLQDICDGALLAVIRLLEVDWVIGVGKFGADRAKAALKSNCDAHSGDKKPKCCGKKQENDVVTYILHGAGKKRGKKTGPPEVRVCSIMHPSPINPATHAGWGGIVTTEFTRLGVLDVVKGTPSGASK